LDLTKENKTDIDLTLPKCVLSAVILFFHPVLHRREVFRQILLFQRKRQWKSNSKNSGGRRFASYTAYVPAGKDYKVKYTVDAKSDYATDGYYGVSGTTLNASSAASLDLTSENKTEINMTLIPKEQ